MATTYTVPKYNEFTKLGMLLMHLHPMCNNQLIAILELHFRYTSSPNLVQCCEIKAKSRKYQGVFEVKSRVKTRQVRWIWSQQLEHKQIPQWGTEPGVRKGKRSLLGHATPVAKESATALQCVDYTRTLTQFQIICTGRWQSYCSFHSIRQSKLWLARRFTYFLR